MTKMKKMDMNLENRVVSGILNMIIRPDDVLSKHSVDHDHHGTDKFETPGLKMISSEDDVGHCDNIISWDDSEKNTCRRGGSNDLRS